MTSRPAIVLLHGAYARPDMWAPVTAGLHDTAEVLAPQLPGLEAEAAGPFSLAQASAWVSTALAAAGVEGATVCGYGLGAMVALRLAADRPQQIGRLVLLTRQTRVSPVLMSLPAAVLRLLPAATVQRMGAGRDQVLALLDQVRPVDVSPLAPTVPVPAVVACGARDRVNRRASGRLAELLPAGRLLLVPRAGPGWVSDSPALLTAVLLEQLNAPG